MRLVRMLLKFPEVGAVVAGLRNMFLGGIDPVNFTRPMKVNKKKLKLTRKMISQCDDLGPALGSFTVLKMLAFGGNLNHPI